MTSSKNKYLLSKLAEEDLIQIFVDSIEQWGPTQAKEYSVQLEATLKRLSNLPDIGKSRNELYPQALSFHVGSHIIFYKKVSIGIEIARILHRRMEYERHLADELEIFK